MLAMGMMCGANWSATLPDILLEFGAAHTLLIEISAPDEASWNGLVQAAMPIVQSFEFTR